MLRGLILLLAVTLALAGCAPIAEPGPAPQAGAGAASATATIGATTPTAPESPATPGATATPGAAGAPADQATPAPAASTADTTPVIVLTRSGGLAGKTAQWSIYGDGRVATPQGTQKTLAPDQVAALLADAQALGFFKLADTYGQNSPCRDCYNYELTITANGQSKTVKAVEGASDMPPALAQIIERINGMVAG